MLQFAHTISAVDSHTEGEPTRIITGGIPPVPGCTMVEKRSWLRDNVDHLRRALVLEPRGHDAIVAAFLTAPADPQATMGVVFANDESYLGMCGHGAIGVATTAVGMGMVPIEEPITEVVLDTPAGLVHCTVRVVDGRPQSTKLRNVPAFVFQRDVIVGVPEIGKVRADVAYGGNWFAFVDQGQIGIDVQRENLDRLLDVATSIRRGLFDEGVRAIHPDRGQQEVIDHVKIYRDLEGDDAPGAVALTLCPGVAYDRSPCGTGTSAKLALLHDQGALPVGQDFVSESILGTRFRARIVETVNVGDRVAVVPEVEGSAYVTGFQQFVIDPEDPLKHGI